MINVLNFIHSHDIKTILDIGANMGIWASTVKYYFPNIEIFSIEANVKCETYLKQKNLNYKICCLSDVVKTVKFYKNKNDEVSSGCSYYLETTGLFNENDYDLLETTTLDSLFKDKTFDFIKMDTQGSEIDIFNGGKNIFKKCKYLQVETSLIEYNKNSPLQNEVFEFLSKNNFTPYSKTEDMYMNGSIIQQDFIFINNNDN